MAEVDWILNDPGEEIWRLRPDIEGVPLSAFSINWSWPQTGRIDTGVNVYWQELAKRVSWWYMESDKTRCTRTTTLSTMAREIRAAAVWLSTAQGCLDAGKVSRADVKGYEDYVKELRLTQGSAELKLIALRLYWTLRNEVGDGLNFDPYVRPGELSKRAKALGRPNQHTPTLKPRQLFGLLNHSLEVLEDGPNVAALVSLYLDFTRTKRPRSFSRETGVSATDLKQRVDITYGAALVIVLALQAFRKHELASVNLRDLSGLSEDPPVLYGRVRKTAASRLGKKTVRPVPTEVARAIEVVRELTERTRDLSGSQYLFVFDNLSARHSRNPGWPLNTRSIYSRIDAFCLDAGYLGILRPHMLRRAFSMLYAWRYEVGDLQFLSRMLYHNNSAFTVAYTNEGDLREFLPEAEKALSFQKSCSDRPGGVRLGYSVSTP